MLGYFRTFPKRNYFPTHPIRFFHATTKRFSQIDPLDHYRTEAQKGDPHAQLILGILLCQKTGQIISNASTVQKDQDQNITKNKKEFLKWVKQEKQRILDRRSTESKEPIVDDIIGENICSACEWIEKSANQAHPVAMYLLGSIMLDDFIDDSVCSFIKEERWNKKEGIKWLWRSATGNIEYNELPPEYVIEALWRKDNIEDQCSLAWYDLGAIYYKGDNSIDVKSNNSLSNNCFKFAAHYHNNPDAMFWLGYQSWESDWNSISPEQRESHPAVQWMNAAALLSHGEAMFFLSWIYYHQILPDKEYEQAVRWMSEGAKNGSARALRTMGDWYSQGPSVAPHFEINFPKAFHYYKDASEAEIDIHYPPEMANQLRSFALCSLGAMYFGGLGTDPDPMKAYDCYQRAAQLGSARACLNLADMFKRGIGVGKNLKSAQRYENLAKQLIEQQNLDASA